MIAVDVNDASGVGGARREAAAVAEQSGLKEADGGRVALVATELATNLVKHGGGGEILVGAYEDGDGSGVEVLALDRGPGIANLAACLEDGYSSAGTAGNGLGAVFRQSDMVEVASWPGVGTAVLTRFKPGAPGRKREPVDPRTAPFPWRWQASKYAGIRGPSRRMVTCIRFASPTASAMAATRPKLRWKRCGFFIVSMATK